MIDETSAPAFPPFGRRAAPTGIGSPATARNLGRYRRGAVLIVALSCGSAHAGEAPPAPPPVIEDMRRPRAAVEVEAAREPRGGECWRPVLDEPATDRRLAERYLEQCPRAGRRADPWMALRIVELERDLGVPDGLIAAAACWEVGYTQNARGDRRADGAMAHGPLQLWPWWIQWGGLTADARDDITAAVRVYVARIYHYLEDGRCPGNWLRAEAMAANGPRYRHHGCDAVSRHGQLWERWK